MAPRARARQKEIRSLLSSFLAIRILKYFADESLDTHLAERLGVANPAPRCQIPALAQKLQLQLVAHARRPQSSEARNLEIEGPCPPHG